MGFSGRVVVVTGGGSGIGQAACRAFCKEGAKVVVVDRDTQTGEHTARMLGEEGSDAFFFKADVSRDDEVRVLALHAAEQFGGIDVLVNNAGIGHDGTVVEDSAEAWDAVIAANLRSAFLCSHYLIPQMEMRGQGSIVNIGSVQSKAAIGRSAAYISSKHGMLGLTKAMAIDHAPMIRVNAVLPGSVDTPLFRAGRSRGVSEESWLESVAARHPLRRIARPDEIAEVIVFLASEKASFLTGACIPVDGGLLAQI